MASGSRHELNQSGGTTIWIIYTKHTFPSQSNWIPHTFSSLIIWLRNGNFNIPTLMFIWYFLFWSAVDSEQQQRRTWYSWCNPSVVNVLNMAEIEEERGMRGSFEREGDGKLRVILGAARRGQSSYSHSPQSSPPSDLCCSLDKYKIGSGVKSYISSSIPIYWLQSSHGACSAVIWLIRRGLCIHSITDSRLLASILRCIDGIPYQEEFVFAALRPIVMWSS